MSLAYLLIEEGLLDELLSALRRHDRADSARLLQDWQHRHAPPPDTWSTGEYYELTAWVQREARMHLDDDRPEYALCLIERYRPQIGADGKPCRYNDAQGLT